MSTESKKAANAARSRAWRLANPERYKANIDRWNKANAERRRQTGKQYYLANKEKLREQGRAWYQANKDKIKHSRYAYSIRWKYGVTEDVLVEMMAKQGNRCAICKTTALTTPNIRLSVDHNHDTGEVRGLLCGSCNAGIALLRESVEILESATNYLRNPPCLRLTKRASLATGKGKSSSRLGTTQRVPSAEEKPNECGADDLPTFMTTPSSVEKHTKTSGIIQ